MRLLLGLLLLAASARADDYPGSPGSVVHAYIEADGLGLGLHAQTAAPLLRLTTWKSPPPADTLTIVKSFDIGEVGWTDNEASVQITYHLLGRLDAFRFTSQPGKKDVFFELVKINGRWKITGPRLSPHLSVPGAITALEAAGASRDAHGRAVLQKLRALE